MPFLNVSIFQSMERVLFVAQINCGAGNSIGWNNSDNRSLFEVSAIGNFKVCNFSQSVDRTKAATTKPICRSNTESLSDPMCNCCQTDLSDCCCGIDPDISREHRNVTKMNVAHRQNLMMTFLKFHSKIFGM